MEESQETQGEERTTLEDEQMDSDPTAATQAEMDDGDDTGDDSGDVSDPSDTGDDTGDDSGEESGTGV